MGRVWHLLQPPGGGISRQAVNMAQPQIKRETTITEERGKLFDIWIILSATTSGLKT
jgi:hypothetical protein